MRKRGFFLLAVLMLCLCSVPALQAAEPAAKEKPMQQILDIEKRGFKNIFTSPGEFKRSLQPEKEMHPKAWPVSYLPRAITNFLTRLGSGVFDVAVLPWYVVPSGDSTPMTRRFDLPDYVWQKE